MVKLTGELVAVDWDVNEDPTELCLDTEGERYSVGHCEFYDELLENVGATVELEGEIDESGDDEPVIEVVNFHVVDAYEDGDDPMDDDAMEEEAMEEEAMVGYEEEELIDEEW